MINHFFANPLSFLIVFPGLLLTITIHEFAHSWMADRLGDPTPRIKGRLTLDPRAHLDPLGVIAILLTRFGWGKPAPYDPYNLKEPVRDTALIAAAGSGSNLLTALALSLIINIPPFPISWISLALAQILVINVYLALFNLLPIGPLDGTKILTALLPKKLAYDYERFMEKNGLFLLILLVMPLINGQSLASRLIASPAQIIISALL
ncbi:MAG: site-2 protease family protein [Candidatus Pacebacteria bacterium]|nr:site-2 protease family protein [Candidatus Paceibacterota bacterium]